MDARAIREKNRLAGQKSPYLLQHQFNPVDWYPWGPEAFAKARGEDKPIFLSIGYSTCHWCHVMERESFENPSVAQALNHDFVSIKVDREERPDVDRIYMQFVQATSGGGGWPLNVFLTPGLKPFFGGTYWPPEGKYGRPGIRDVLAQVAEAWRTRRQEIVGSAESIHRQIETAIVLPTSGSASDPGVLDEAARLFKSAYDARNGGFGGAPKFPQPAIPAFLLRHAPRTQDREAVEMVLRTCDRMKAGGIYDQLGGGFSRYSVDAEWLVPHFEKMLYDNAQLAHLYLDAWVLSKNQKYADTARGILDYVLQDMTSPEGGFYSAEDADSEGHEGKFYCWTAEELDRLLSADESAVAKKYFGITVQGNFVDHSHPSPLPNQNVLSLADPHLTGAEQRLLESAREKMIAARSRRVRPHLDDKILASWNGLMLGAMARAGVVLEHASYLEAAERNAAFVKANLWESGRLFHRWRDGERDAVELLEGYAFMLEGLLHLYEATLKPAHLEFATAIADKMIERFFDREHGGFWQSAGTQDLVLRLKPDYDGAEPSGNSVATLALLKLGRITGRDQFLEAARKTLAFFSNRLASVPQAMPYLLQALEFDLHEPTRIVIAGQPDAPDTRELLRAAHSVFHPDKIVLGTEGCVEEFARSLASGGPPKAFLCTGTECKPPVTAARDLARML